MVRLKYKWMKWQNFIKNRKFCKPFIIVANKCLLLQYYNTGFYGYYKLFSSVSLFHLWINVPVFLKHDDDDDDDDDDDELFFWYGWPTKGV